MRIGNGTMASRLTLQVRDAFFLLENPNVTLGSGDVSPRRKVSRTSRGCDLQPISARVLRFVERFVGGEDYLLNFPQPGIRFRHANTNGHREQTVAGLLRSRMWLGILAPGRSPSVSCPHRTVAAFQDPAHTKLRCFDDAA